MEPRHKFCLAQDKKKLMWKKKLVKNMLKLHCKPIRLRMKTTENRGHSKQKTRVALVGPSLQIPVPPL